MKRKILSLAIVLAMLLSFVPGTSQAEEPIKIWINGNYVESDSAPVIENNRTLVPVRIITENLGFEVSWDPDTKTVLVYKIKDGKMDEDSKQLALTIGDTRVGILNSKEAIAKDKLFVELDAPAKIINNRTMVPVRFIAEEFGQKVDWDGASRTVVIGEGYVPTPVKTEEKKEVKETPKPQPKKISTEFKNALKTAQLYSDKMHMSKKGLYNQLTSQYGEKFPADAAQYAVDNVKADWNANALATAKLYQDKMHMSKEAIRNQLISEYGEKFTPEEAEYAIQHLD